ncbi:hypothetical protein NKH18_19505 [Streptomyces sp. M10(2022)]
MTTSATAGSAPHRTDNPGDPGPADEYPLPDLAAAETPKPSAEPSKATGGSEESDKPAAAAKSTDSGNSALWIGLGIGAAVLIAAVVAVAIVRSRRRGAAATVQQPHPYQQQPQPRTRRTALRPVVLDPTRRTEVLRPGPDHLNSQRAAAAPTLGRVCRDGRPSGFVLGSLRPRLSATRRASVKHSARR